MKIRRVTAHTVRACVPQSRTLPWRATLKAEWSADVLQSRRRANVVRELMRRERARRRRAFLRAVGLA